MKWTVLLALVTLMLSPLQVQAEQANGLWRDVENRPGCKVWAKAPKEEETVTWTGECANGRPQGFGTLTWKYWENGAWRKSEYVGDMLAGKMYGKGQKTYHDGSRYEGDWVDDMANGEGTLILANGTRHEGTFVMHNVEGHGKRIYPDGSFYSGNWSGNAMNGRGIFSLANGKQCVGQWKDNKLVGIGEGRIPGQPERTTCRMVKGHLQFGDGDPK